MTIPLLFDCYPLYLRYLIAILLITFVLKIFHRYPIAIQRQENISQKLKFLSTVQSFSKIYFKVLEKKIKIEKVMHEKLKLNVVNQKNIFGRTLCKKNFKFCEKEVKKKN